MRFPFRHSEDGAIRRHDVRQPRPSSANREFIQLEREITGIQYHPLLDNLFITSGSPGNVLLWDARMAFTRKTEGVIERVNKIICLIACKSFIYTLVSYQGDTPVRTLRLFTRTEQRGIRPGRSDACYPGEISTHFYVCRHEICRHVSCKTSQSQSVFMRGTQWFQRKNYFPTIYSLNDPDPLAVLSAQFLPNGSPIPLGQRTYSNACTMKVRESKYMYDLCLTCHSTEHLVDLVRTLRTFCMPEGQTISEAMSGKYLLYRD